MPRKTDSQHPADWLDLAEADLEGLRILAEREAAYQLCRSKLAEVVEKILKAELLRHGWFLVKTHDLEQLRSKLGDFGSDLAAAARSLCEDLAEAYFSDRYPGFDLEDPDWPKLRLQLGETAALLEAVRGRLAGAQGR